MRKILFVCSGIALIIVAGLYFYSHPLTTSTTKSLWDLVPGDAAIVYQSKKTPVKQKSEFTARIQKALRKDSVLIGDFDSRDMMLSLHAIGKKDFGIVFYRHDSTILQHPFFGKSTTLPARQKKRNFEGYAITDLSTEKNGIISYTIIDNDIVLSRESFLIEDVIRLVTTEKNGFKKNNAELFTVAHNASHAGNLYFNLKQLAKFCNVFAPEEINSAMLKTLGSGLVSDLRIEDQTVFMSGFATDSSGNTAALALFNDQQPVPVEIHKLVSNRALSFVHYGISDINAWVKRRTDFCKSVNPSILQTSNVNAKEFYSALGNEIGQCRFESTDRSDDIFMLKIKNAAAEKLRTILVGDLTQSETYASYAIHKIASPLIIYTMLWPLTENKNLNYYCKYDKYLLFSDNTDALKKFLADLEEENTWGKSTEWNDFFSSSSLENNLEFVFNGNLLFPSLNTTMLPQWTSAVKSLQKPEKGLFQFTRLGKTYSFNGLLEFDFRKKTDTRSPKNSIVAQTDLNAAILRLFPVKNHNSNETELLLQTKDKVLHLMSANLKSLFTLTLNSDINSEVHQIDYYKNKKLQYLFLAGNELYLVDRLGNNVKGFPKQLAISGSPKFLSVVDYNNDRNYHFLIASDKGVLTMLNKAGEPLPGWDAKQTGLLLNSARLVQDNGANFIVAVDTKGTISAYNSKGEMAAGFPVRLAIRPEGDWIYEKSATGGVITMVGGDGVKAQVTMAGKVAEKENFVRSSVDSKFSLVTTSARNTCVISRVDNGKLAILATSGEIIFEIENSGSETLDVNFQDLGAGEKIFMFRDLQQDFTSAFDQQGRSILTHPLETSLDPVFLKRPKEKTVVITAYREQLKKVYP